jgi:hypothetical protein
MAKNPNNDPFAAIRNAHTGGPNYDLDTNAIIERLTKWQSLCSFSVTGAKGDAVDIKFATLLKDMDAFVRDLYEFCPDLVDQGTGCLGEMLGVIVKEGKKLTPQMKKLIEGVDFENEDYGLEILKRELQQNRSVRLWWD